MRPVDVLRAAVREILLTEVDLGDVVFSPIRADGAPTDEPNTADEDALFSGLEAWITGRDGGVFPDLRAAAQDPRYAEFFSPPPGRKIYRGMNIGAVKLRKWLGGEWPTESGSATVDLVLGPGDAGGASWSYKAETARAFTYGSMAPRGGPSGWGVVLEAETVSTPGAMVDVSKVEAALLRNSLAPWLSEAEVLQFEPLHVKRITWRRAPVGVAAL